MGDTFYTLESPAEGWYKEKMSKFLAFAVPVTTAEEAKDVIVQYQKKYHDARHVCWAYMIGAAREEFQSNDNGEPSGTAGKPILGQINSMELTDVLVVVVRYFGGIKLGTSGLISAYREAARLALEEAGRKECRQMRRLGLEFSYETADSVMRIIKNPEVTIVSKTFDNMCHAVVEFPLDLETELTGRLSKVEGIMIETTEV